MIYLFIYFSFRLFLVGNTSSLSRWPRLAAKKEKLKRHVQSIQTQLLHRWATVYKLSDSFIYLLLFIYGCFSMQAKSSPHFCHFPQAPCMQPYSMESALVEQHDTNWEYLLRDITPYAAAQNLSRDSLKNVTYSSGCVRRWSIKRLLKVWVVNLFVEFISAPFFNTADKPIGLIKEI